MRVFMFKASRASFYVIRGQVHIVRKFYTSTGWLCRFDTDWEEW